MTGRGANPARSAGAGRPPPTIADDGASGPGGTEHEGPARVGRDGLVVLGFDRVGPRTVLTERRFRLPLQVLEPIELDGSGAATVMLLNPTGGVLGGDRLETAVRLGAGSHVCLVTPAATRVYRSGGAAAIQTCTVRVGPGAALEYLPDHLIPSPGARLRQRTEIALERGGTAIVLESWAVGRAARGEAWQFAELDMELRLGDGDGPLFRDRAVLHGLGSGAGAPRAVGLWPAGLGGTEGLGYVATLAAVAPAHRDWGGLAAEMEETLGAAASGAARFGVTVLGRGGLVARLLLPSAPVLRTTVGAMWALCRARLLGLSPLHLRKL